MTPERRPTGPPGRLVGVAIHVHVDVVGDRIGHLLGEVPEQAGAAGEQGDARTTLRGTSMSASTAPHTRRR